METQGTPEWEQFESLDRVTNEDLRAIADDNSQEYYMRMEAYNMLQTRICNSQESGEGSISFFEKIEKETGSFQKWMEDVKNAGF